MKALVLLSGGLDSSTLLYDVMLRTEITEVMAVGMNYGQRHEKELYAAEMIAAKNDIFFKVLNLASIAEVLVGSSQTSKHIDVPDGHYADETMKLTVVPNRNMIMISLIGALAIQKKADKIFIAVHGGDHYIYPDCRPGFISGMDIALHAMSEGVIRLEAPYLNWTKAEIVKRGAQLNVPFGLTWSCYKGGIFHCGTCGTCVERKEAFQLAEVKDPTLYLNDPIVTEA